MAPPNLEEVRRTADYLRKPDFAAEQRGDDLMRAAWLREQPLEVIADFLAEVRAEARRRGRPPKSRHRQANTALRWLLINRRIARWRGAYAAKAGLCRRSRLAAEREYHPSSALEWAFDQVVDETGFGLETIRARWKEYGGDALEENFRYMMRLGGRAVPTRANSALNF